MPVAYSCEGILATVDWAHALLKAHGKTSGYAMDPLLKKKASSPRPGQFARYLRGENAPNMAALMMLGESSLANARIQLPLYGVLGRGYAEVIADERWIEVTFELERWLDYRLTRFEESSVMLEVMEPSPERALTLTAYANSAALTALLLWACIQQHEADSDDQKPGGSGASLLLGQRAFQCLILTMAAGEFAQTGPVLSACIRQRVLDHLHWQGQCLDTSSIDLAAAVAVGRRLLAQSRVATLSTARQRSALRSLLSAGNSADLEAITPKVVSKAEALRARHQHPVSLTFPTTPDAKANRVSGYGIKARALLLRELAGYVHHVDD